MNGAVRETGPMRELARAPVRESTRRRLEGPRNDLGDLARVDLPGATRAGSLVQSDQALRGEPASDATDLDRRIPGSTSDFDAGKVVGHQQHGSSPAVETRRRPRGSSQSLQFGTLLGVEDDRTHAVGHDSPQGSMASILT